MIFPNNRSILGCHLQMQQLDVKWKLQGKELEVMLKQEVLEANKEIEEAQKFLSSVLNFTAKK